MGKAQDVSLVDLLLVLAIDGSGSTKSDSGDEFRWQIMGHAQAIQHPSVLKSIKEGATGSIAVAALVWSILTHEEGIATEVYDVCVPWTRIAASQDAEVFSAKLTRICSPLYQGTSIADGLKWSFALFDESPFQATRKVVDVATDEISALSAVRKQRERAIRLGIEINGLALEHAHAGSISRGRNVYNFLQQEVITPGAFVLHAGKDTCVEMLQRKFAREIRGVV